MSGITLNHSNSNEDTMTHKNEYASAILDTAKTMVLSPDASKDASVYDATARAWQNYIDLLRLYNRTLSASDVLTMLGNLAALRSVADVVTVAHHVEVAACAAGAAQAYATTAPAQTMQPLGDVNMSVTGATPSRTRPVVNPSFGQLSAETVEEDIKRMAGNLSPKTN